MAAPVAGPSTQAAAPPATANLLRSLAPVHSTYFPRLPTPSRPETNEANTPELKEDAKNKVALLKSVLGTYFSDVEMDLFNNQRGTPFLTPFDFGSYSSPLDSMIRTIRYIREVERVR